MGSAIRKTKPLKCDTVVFEHEEGVVTITMKVGNEIAYVYQVVPELKVNGVQATATISLNNVTFREDDIPF